MASRYDVVNVVLGVSIGFGQGFDFPYPSGRAAVDYLTTGDHLIISNSSPIKFQRSGDFSLSFGASAIRMTLLQGSVYVEGERLFINLDRGVVTTDSVNTTVNTAVGGVLGGVTVDGDTLAKLKTKIADITALLASDDAALDTLQELVDAIEVQQATQDNLLVNDLTSTSQTKALTANMGRVLSESIKASGPGFPVISVMDGQTILTLSSVPTDATSVVLEVNGIRYRPTFDFTVAGNQLTWLNSFALESSDIVFVSYI